MRGADDFYLAGRSVSGADPKYPAWRRRIPPYRGRGAAGAARDNGATAAAGRHKPHCPHGGDYPQRRRVAVGFELSVTVMARGSRGGSQRAGSVPDLSWIQLSDSRDSRLFPAGYQRNSSGYSRDRRTGARFCRDCDAGQSAQSETLSRRCSAVFPFPDRASNRIRLCAHGAVALHQRDIEQRLKDAIRHDRARVQMGKISRFGLMELSRQRIRPSLSEGSHVTCPRCNGTGHIRDTESSALQVLRLIQEEAMKEHTAAIHCQAPVEVTAFLLNEKRQEINKIEARF